MPAWRRASVRAASCVVCSGRSSPASAVSAIPMPRPAAACGTKVHATRASGSHASASTPAPISALPTAARTRGSPCTRVPANAPSGMTLTVAAAAIGETLQPGDEQEHQQEQDRAERGRHHRQRERRPPGERLGRARAPTGAPASARRARRRPRRAAIGAWNTKIACQENSSVSTPPSAGPMAVPRTAAPAHMPPARRPRRRPGSRTPR